MAIGWQNPRLRNNHQDTASAYPGGLHLHIPLGPDHVVLVGGHWHPRTGTEPRVPGPESPMEKKDVTVMDESERSKATQCALLWNTLHTTASKTSTQVP